MTILVPLSFTIRIISEKSPPDSLAGFMLFEPGRPLLCPNCQPYGVCVYGDSA